MGMSGSGFIAAVNTVPNAPIFNVADICIVDELTTFIPALVEVVEKEPVGSL